MISFGRWRQNDAARDRDIAQAAIAKLPPHVQAEITATLRDQPSPTGVQAAAAPAYVFVVRAGKTRTFNAIREVAWARPDLLGVTFDRRWMGERRQDQRAGPVERRKTERRSVEVDRDWVRRGFVLSTMLEMEVGAGVSAPHDIQQTREVRRDSVPGVSAPGPTVIVPAAAVSSLVDAAPVDAVRGSDEWRSPLPALAEAIGPGAPPSLPAPAETGVAPMDAEIVRADAATLSGEVAATLLESVSVAEAMGFAAEDVLIARSEVAPAAEEVVEPIAAALARSEVTPAAEDVAEPIAVAFARSEMATPAEDVAEPIAVAFARSEMATPAEDVAEPIVAAFARPEVAPAAEDVVEPIAAGAPPEVATPAEDVIEPVAAALALLEAAAWMDEALAEADARLPAAKTSLADAVDGGSEQVSSVSSPNEGFPEPEDVEPAAVEAAAPVLEAEFVADEMASPPPDPSFAPIEVGAVLTEAVFQPEAAERAPTEPTLALDEAVLEPVAPAAAGVWSLADLGAATPEPVPDPGEVLVAPVDVEAAPSALAVPELAPATALDDVTLEPVALASPADVTAADLEAAAFAPTPDSGEGLAVPVDVEPAPSAFAVPERAPAAALDDVVLEPVALASPADVTAADLEATAFASAPDLGEGLAVPVDVEPAPSVFAVPELAPVAALDDVAVEPVALAPSDVTAADLEAAAFASSADLREALAVVVPELAPAAALDDVVLEPVALAPSAVEPAADPVEAGYEPVGSVPGPWENLAASIDAEPAPAEAATELVGTESVMDEVEASMADLVAAATAPSAAAASVEITAPPVELVTATAAAAIGSVETASPPGADVRESEAQPVPFAAVGARLRRAGKAKPRGHVHRCGRCGRESRHEGFCVIPTVTDLVPCSVCDVARSRRPRVHRAVAAAIAGLALLPALWLLFSIPWPSGQLASLRAPADPGAGRPAPSPEAPMGATVKPSREMAKPGTPAAPHRPPPERVTPPGSGTARLDAESRPAPTSPPAVSAGRPVASPSAARQEPGGSSVAAVPPPSPKPELPHRAPPSDSPLAEAGRASTGPPSGSVSSGVAPLESGAPPASPTVARPTPVPSDRPQAPHSAPAPSPGSAIATAQAPPSGQQSLAPPPEKVASDVGIRGAPPPGTPGGSFAMLASTQGIRVGAAVPGRQPGLGDGPAPSVVRPPRSDAAGPAMVRILPGAGQSGAPRGLGFVVDGRGYVLTHSDVIRDGKGLQAALADGRTFPVREVWRDPLAGVAVLRIDGRDLPALPLGDSGGLRVGDATAVVGWPTASARPPVSATIRATGSATGGNLAIDAPIPTEDVGGPLIDARGQVVGIATADAHVLDGRSRGFAVPIDRAKSMLRQAQASAAPARPGFTSGR